MDTLAFNKKQRSPMDGYHAGRGTSSDILIFAVTIQHAFSRMSGDKWFQRPTTHAATFPTLPRSTCKVTSRGLGKHEAPSRNYAILSCHSVFTMLGLPISAKSCDSKNGCAFRLRCFVPKRLGAGSEACYIGSLRAELVLSDKIEESLIKLLASVLTCQPSRSEF